ncbi:MAG: hypothetical protein AAFN17_06730, partial [Pseudomonadota bacterium]
MLKGVSVLERLVKIGLGVGKIYATGGASLTTAQDVIGVVKNGRGLMDDLTTADAQELASQLIARAEGRIEALGGHPDFADGRLQDAKRHFEQAIPLCLPEPAWFVETRLDAPAIATQMLNTAARAGRDKGEEFPDYYESDNPETAYSRDFFLEVTTAVLTPVVDDPAFASRLQPDLWRGVFGQLDRMEGMLAEVLRILEERGVSQAAEAAGVQRFAIMSLAKKSLPEVRDIGEALNEIERLVGIAIEVQEGGHRSSNLGEFVDEVIARAAALSAEGLYPQAVQTIDEAIAAEDRAEEERQARLTRLLEEGERADLLNRDAKAAASKIARRLRLDHPTETDGFVAIRTERRKWYERGQEKGVNLDLEVSAHLAEDCFS